MSILSQDNGESVRACAFSPNGLFIASSDDSGSVNIWGQNKNLIKIIRQHEEAVHAIAFSSDSKLLLTGCTLGNIRLFLTNEINESKYCELCLG